MFVIYLILIYIFLGYILSNYICNLWEALPNHFAGSRIDEKIKKQFGVIFLVLSSYIFYPLTFLFAKVLTAHVILWDQVSRHLYRSNIFLKEKWNNRAYNLAFTRINNLRKHSSSISMLDRWCFIAVRHKLNTSKELDENGYNTLLDMQNKVEKVWNSMNNATKQALLKNKRNRYDGDMFEIFHNAEDTANFINNIEKSVFIENKLVKAVITSLNENSEIIEETVLGISLSGGCDSMVCLIVIILLNRFGYLPKLKTIKISHINYQQRNLATKEAEFLVNYANKLGSNIELDIDIKISTCQPASNFQSFTDYDKHATETRFNSYISSGAKFFIVGHNIGDVLENVLQNIFNVGSVVKCSLLEICGMTYMTNRLGTNIYRPLLLVEKEQIKDFCDMAKIPFFYDSSNPNCTRIKIRRILVDSLINVFGKNVIYNAVRNFYNKCHLYRSFIETLNKKLIQKIINYENVSVLDITDIEETKFFCLEQLPIILNTYTPLHPSNKSLNQLIDYINVLKRKNVDTKRFFNLNENIPFYILMNRGKIFLIMIKENCDIQISINNLWYRVVVNNFGHSLNRIRSRN